MSDVYVPVSGVVQRGERGARRRARSWSTRIPYGEGWILEVTLADPAELDGLMDADAYRALVGED